jgi:hypothetical protein
MVAHDAGTQQRVILVCLVQISEECAAAPQAFTAIAQDNDLYKEFRGETD